MFGKVEGPNVSHHGGGHNRGRPPTSHRPPQSSNNRSQTLKSPAQEFRNMSPADQITFTRDILKDGTKRVQDPHRKQSKNSNHINGLNTLKKGQGHTTPKKGEGHSSRTGDSQSMLRKSEGGSPKKATSGRRGSNNKMSIVIADKNPKTLRKMVSFLNI